MNDRQSIAHSICSLPLRQKVFIGFLFLLALGLSVLMLRYVDPLAAEVHSGSGNLGLVTSQQSAMPG